MNCLRTIETVRHLTHWVRGDVRAYAMASNTFTHKSPGLENNERRRDSGPRCRACVQVSGLTFAKTPRRLPYLLPTPLWKAAPTQKIPSASGLSQKGGGGVEIVRVLIIPLVRPVLGNHGLGAGLYPPSLRNGATEQAIEAVMPNIQTNQALVTNNELLMGFHRLRNVSCRERTTV